MKAQNIEGAVKDAAELIRKTPAIGSHKNASYAIVVKVGYEEIQKLRNDGYGYDIICKTLSDKGALAVDAKPKYLRIAFMRETKRRLSRTRMNSSTPGPGSGSMRKATSVTASPNKVVQNKTGETNRAEQEQERINKMTREVINTGTGKVVKNADGTFDY